MRKRHRGRPPTDDAEKLQALAALLRRDPELCVTAAIRALEIIHPSEIRRLRDKHRKFRRIVPGKSAPRLDEVYLTQLFDRLKSDLYPTAKIFFREEGIAVFSGRSARTLHIPGRASALWVKTTFVPRVTQFLRKARDQRIVDVFEETNVTVEEIGAAFGMTKERVYQIRKRERAA